jgi:hypothetical protein
MPPRGEDPAPRSVTDSQPVRILKVVASVAVAFLVISLVALVWAPKDPGTLTLYGLVIGLNLLILLAFWPAVKWLQRLSR